MWVQGLFYWNGRCHAIMIHTWSTHLVDAAISHILAPDCFPVAPFLWGATAVHSFTDLSSVDPCFNRVYERGSESGERRIHFI
jgi:hypothetical protein